MKPHINEEVIKNINSLIQLDIDAIHAYRQAIEKCDVHQVKGQLDKFRQDHERHVQNLSECVTRLGGTPPEFKRDFKGFFLEGFTALRSVTGTVGALKAMKSNEMLTNQTYEKALSWNLPVDVRNVVSRNRDDEKRHLQYIERALDQRFWEAPRKAA
jgi:uncharacterized protein (TIGR02284 family)